MLRPPPTRSVVRVPVMYNVDVGGRGGISEGTYLLRREGHYPVAAAFGEARNLRKRGRQAA